MEDIFVFLRKRYLKLLKHNLCLSHKIVTIVYFIIILINIFSKILLMLCLALLGSIVHKLIIHNYWAEAPEALTSPALQLMN